ncbi:Disease resistance protein RML1B [Cardamine amara subsp. amara]|uniref:ADP-ribosyl cyclase/cyclic ADP-ribose hydrolase n=1 Tax=Cardamine amara subsp. amara TaxID=228776 RepID=A0ABD1C7I7_CARAN
MAAAASSSSSTWRYRIFPSFHGQDVRKTFLSHLRKEFDRNGITMFDDHGIERSQTIAPALTRAIRESRISIVVLSNNYASSSWCLNELLEILKSKESMQQIVMTIFYGTDPSDVGKQTGDFGRAFNETCEGKSKEEKQRWSKALTDVGNIAGEHFLNWDNEADMIENIVGDVSNKLYATPSRDFDDMVGFKLHISKMTDLLCLQSEEVKIVGICGPAGIGKTTIARALYSLLSSKFHLCCFMENVRESYNSGLDEYGLKLRLQEQFLSKVLNRNHMKVHHLGEIQERLCDQKVLIVLDDVNNLEHLDALANDTTWFGPGSRIILTTENKELLQQHGINNIYNVDFPSNEEALEILCKHAFRQSSPHDGFKKLAERVKKLCDNLPLGLRVMGLSLRGKKEDEWEAVVHRLETSLDRDIEKVLRVGYENLHEKDQALFLCIAVFFNYKDYDHMKVMLAHSNFDVKHGLKTLINKSLVYKSFFGKIVMHKLLQQVGRQAVLRQEPWRRHILIDANEICDILENDTGTRKVMGISFDISEIIGGVFISEGAFKRLRNLQFLKVYKTKLDGNDRLHTPEGMEFPPRLRLLHWEAYPGKCLPPTFIPEYIVELHMQDSQLKRLWKGTQPLTNLKKMVLTRSYHLKELPDLSNATNLEQLDLSHCTSLVEVPSSFSNLRKLTNLMMSYCTKLEVVPPNMNLPSLEWINMDGCSRLSSFPYLSTNIKTLLLSKTVVEELSPLTMFWSHLEYFKISNNLKLKTLTHVPKRVTSLDLSYSGIETISDCLKDLNRLYHLHLVGCKKLVSLPELPGKLISLNADNCESLKLISPLATPNTRLSFTNCFKLDQKAQRLITQQPYIRGYACFPGRKVPAEFDHIAIGNSFTVFTEDIFPDSSSVKICAVISPLDQQTRHISLSFRLKGGDHGSHITGVYFGVDLPSAPAPLGIQMEHLFIFHCDVADEDRIYTVDNKIVFEFSSSSHEIIECGVKKQQPWISEYIRGSRSWW